MKKIDGSIANSSSVKRIENFCQYFKDTPIIIYEEKKKEDFKPFTWDETCEVL